MTHYVFDSRGYSNLEDISIQLFVCFYDAKKTVRAKVRSQNEIKGGSSNYKHVSTISHVIDVGGIQMKDLALI